MQTIISSLAESLRNAEETKIPIPPIATKLPSVEDAYAVQEANTVHWTSAGRRLVGRKIGLTSRSVQKQLGVNEPDYGMLFADMMIPDGWELSRARLIQPKLEGEVAFVLGRDLDLEQITIADVIRAIDFAVPAIEIVDSRIKDWKISLYDTVADNASSGLYVIGNEPKRLDKLNLRDAGMAMELGGEKISFGEGAACLGHPLNAVWWLAHVMKRVDHPVKSGDTVLSGALVPMVAPKWDGVVEMRINGLGAVHLGLVP